MSELFTEYRMTIKGWKNRPDNTFVSTHHHASPNSVAYERARIGEKGISEWQPHITEVIVEKRVVSDWEPTTDLDPLPPDPEKSFNVLDLVTYIGTSQHKVWQNRRGRKHVVIGMSDDENGGPFYLCQAVGTLEAPWPIEDWFSAPASVLTYWEDRPPPRPGRFILDVPDLNDHNAPGIRSYGSDPVYIAKLLHGWSGFEARWEEA